MRKLKGEKEQKRKAKEEKEFEEKKREEEILNQMPFTKFDYIVGLLKKVRLCIFIEWLYLQYFL